MHQESCCPSLSLLQKVASQFVHIKARVGLNLLILNSNMSTENAQTRIVYKLINVKIVLTVYVLVLSSQKECKT